GETVGRSSHRARPRGGEGGYGLFGGGRPQRRRPAEGRGGPRPSRLHRGHPSAVPGSVPVRRPRRPEAQGRAPTGHALPGGAGRGGRKSVQSGTGGAVATDRPRPRPEPAQGSLG